VSLATLLLAWGASLLALGLEPSGALRTGLVLLPWLALAGLPGGRTRGLLSLALALPLLGVALGLDHAGGARFGSSDLLWIGIAAAVLVLWTSAAVEAREAGSGTRRLQAALWFLCVPGLAALWLAVVWSTRTGPGAETPAWARWIPRTSPVAWVLDAAAAGRDAGRAGRDGLFVLAITFLAWGTVRWRARRDARAEAPR